MQIKLYPISFISGCNLARKSPCLLAPRIGWGFTRN